jgi:hypothetical protein
MIATPPTLLRDIYWSFAEPVPSSPEALAVALREYAAEVDAPDGSAKLLQPLPFTDILVRYTYGYRAASGEWTDKTQELRVVAPPSVRLTGAALL